MRTHPPCRAAGGGPECTRGAGPARRPPRPTAAGGGWMSAGPRLATPRSGRRAIVRGCGRAGGAGRGGARSRGLRPARYPRAAGEGRAVPRGIWAAVGA